MAEIYRHQQAQEIGSVGSVVLMETFSDALPLPLARKMRSIQLDYDVLNEWSCLLGNRFIN